MRKREEEEEEEEVVISMQNRQMVKVGLPGPDRGQQG